MDVNPYSRLANLLSGLGGSDPLAGLTPIMRRGTVKSAAPLIVDVEGITASGSELLINSELLSHVETIVPTNPALSSFEATVTPKLEPGDTVLLLTYDDQLFNILCKVVTA